MLYSDLMKVSRVVLAVWLGSVAQGCGDGSAVSEDAARGPGRRDGPPRRDAGIPGDARRADGAGRSDAARPLDARADAPVTPDAAAPPDAARTPDARAADGPPATADGPAPRCPAQPVPDPTWLAAFQERVVAQLSGQQPLPSGARLADRNTPANRAAARAYLVALWAELGLVGQVQDYGTGANVYADLPATRASDQYIVLGAHFDSVAGSPGANDNATGVALVYAVARHLASVPCRAMNVRFVLFDEEEAGLVGSYHFASFLSQTRVRVTAAHTVDQMGWDANDDRLIELERPDSGLFELYQDGVSSGALSIPLRRTTTNTTDHARFRQFGFGAVGLTEGYTSGDTTPHYHQPTDAYATVDFAYLRSTTLLVSFVLASDLRVPAAPTARRGAWPAPAFAPLPACRGAAALSSAR